MIADRLAERLNEQCWAAWADLGASTVVSPLGVVVDPESLLVLTLGLRDRLEPRLRDVVGDWCIAEGRWLSATRLAAVAEAVVGSSWKEVLGSFAGEIATAGGPAWRFAASAAGAHEYRGKARLETLRSPQRLTLRCRALSGVGARGDVLAILLAVSAPQTIAEMVARTRYTKRSILRAVADLEAAGIAAVARVRGPARVSLAADTLVAWRPGVVMPDWIALARVALEVLALSDRAAGFPDTVLGIEGRALLARERVAVAAAGLTPPSEELLGDAYTREFLAWVADPISAAFRSEVEAH